MRPDRAGTRGGSRRFDARRQQQLAVVVWVLIAVALYLPTRYFWLPDTPAMCEVACNKRPAETRMVAGIVLLSLFLLFIVYRPTAKSGEATDEPRFRSLTHLAPAGVALGTIVMWFAAMLLTNYLTSWRSVIGADAPAEAAFLAEDELREVFTLTRGTRGKDQAPTTSALLLWASMYALTIIAAVVSLWVTAGLWVSCRARRFRAHLSLRFGAIAVISLGAIVALSWRDFSISTGFGGLIGAAMLCGTWQRVAGGSPQRLAEMSDALNVVGVAIPLAVVFGACLLLEVLGRKRTDIESPIGVVKDIARAMGTLDTLLYVGAAALVAGTLQVSALYALTFAHVPTLAEVKVKRDICRVASDSAKDFSAACKDLPRQYEDAERGVPLRQFAKLLTLGFGFGYSVLLGAIYLGAATPLTAYARRLVLSSTGGDESAARARLVDLGIESDLAGKLGKVATTLSPLAAGLVSNLFGSAV